MGVVLYFSTVVFGHVLFFLSSATSVTYANFGRIARALKIILLCCGSVDPAAATVRQDFGKLQVRIAKRCVVGGVVLSKTLFGPFSAATYLLGREVERSGEAKARRLVIKVLCVRDPS